MGPFHPLFKPGPFHPPNLRSAPVDRPLHRDPHTHDIAEQLVPTVGKPPPDPSDMSNLEFRGQTGLSKREIPYVYVPPRFRGAPIP